MSKDVGKMTYFAGLKSRGPVVQMVAAYSDVSMDVELIGFDEWGQRKSEALPFMPYITQADGTIMLETSKILKHVATVGGKLVVDETQDELEHIANSAPLQLVSRTGSPTLEPAAARAAPSSQWCVLNSESARR